MDKLIDLKDRLKELRLSKKMSQNDLAKLLGVDKVAVSQWERGVRQPKLEYKEALCDYFNVNMDYLLGRTDYTTMIVNPLGVQDSAIRIPVLGEVPCGIPLEAIEILDSDEWEELSPSYAGTGKYYGLHAKGDSMSPRIQEGDVLIVKVQSDAESGDIVIAKVNGDDACCKRLIKREDGIVLQSFNPAYDPMVFSSADCESIPVTICAKVIENRQKF